MEMDQIFHINQEVFHTKYCWGFLKFVTFREEYALTGKKINFHIFNAIDRNYIISRVL